MLPPNGSVRAAIALALLLVLAHGSAGAAELRVRVLSEAGEPLPDAVVYALPLDPDVELPTRPQEPAIIDQIDKQYVPQVTVIRTGTKVLFPNHDQIRHHVYSFSDAKTFEIPLYKGLPPDPVRFDRPGEVVLGCNIHDWMRAYVLVVETPYHAVTGPDGRARLALPGGSYRVEAWHPELAQPAADTGRELRLAPDATDELRFSIVREPVWRPRRSPLPSGPDY